MWTEINAERHVHNQYGEASYCYCPSPPQHDEHVRRYRKLIEEVSEVLLHGSPTYVLNRCSWCGDKQEENDGRTWTSDMGRMYCSYICYQEARDHYS